MQEADPWLKHIEEAFGAAAESTPADTFGDNRADYERRFSKLTDLCPGIADSTFSQVWYFRPLTDLAKHCRDQFEGTLEKPKLEFVSSMNGTSDHISSNGALKKTATGS